MVRKALFIIASAVLILIIFHSLKAPKAPHALKALQAQTSISITSTSIGATAVDSTNGAKLLNVDTSGPAYRFGLQKGDMVLKINSQIVKGAQSFFNLINSVMQGSVVSIQVIRNGVETTVGRISSGGFGGQGGMGGGRGGGMGGGRGGGMGGGRGGMGGGRGGMGGGRSRTTGLVKQYDKNGDGWLNLDERKAARQVIGGTGGYQSTVTPGPKLTPADVKSFPDDIPLYDIKTLRTLFMEFEEADWEAELEDFYHTDVEVTAKLTVDGKVYQNVGVRFRGNTSFQRNARGRKRPLNLTLDLVDEKQRLYGYRTLNLLTSNSDPTFTRQILYSHIARQYIPALKANYIRLVINGESWGVYINYQQFNTDFVKDEFDTRKGARWKVPVNMGRGGGGGSGLAYLGDNVASYRSIYQIKSADDPNSWAALINLCKVLNQTPAEKLEEALEPILDIDETLRFLALDKTLINNDGYWTRASDYLLYQDKKGRFHIIPYDTSETMSEVESMNGGGGVSLDPYAGAYDSGKPLLSKLLLVPSLRQRYLGYIRDIAEKWLTWDKIGPLAQQYQALIAADIKTDNHKQSTTEAFTNGLTQDSGSLLGGFSGGGRGGGRGGFGGASISLKSFVEERQTYLLGLSIVSNATLPVK